MKKKDYKKELVAMMDEADRTHRIWHAIERYLQKWYYTMSTRFKWDLTKTKRKFRYFESNEVKGWPAIKRMEKFMKDNPDSGMVQVRVDDSYFAGSDVFLIPHKSEKSWMGVTVMYIPQCSPDMNQYFLYPHHLRAMIEGLQEMERQMNEYKDIEE